MFQRIIFSLYKIFIVWLVLQFFLQTFVTHALELSVPWLDYIWLWKEVVVVLLWVCIIGSLIYQWWWRTLWKGPIWWYTALLLLAIWFSIAIHMWVLELWIDTYVLAFKYDFLWFVILLIWYHSSTLLGKQQKNDLLVRFGRFMKYLLLWALLRYFIIFIKPGTLKLFGYDNFVYEGSVWLRPPAAYYTLINHGMTRNQFLFERPISWWFYLTAFFPLFFVLCLWKQPFKWTWAWWFIYALNIVLTFSRAAWIAWFVQLVIIILLLYWPFFWRHRWKLVVPILLCLVGVVYAWWYLLSQRSYSTNGHIEMINQSINIISWNPLRWQWWSSAGPWSHRMGEFTHLRREGMDPADGFNPENQFLQIIIEFGFIWFVRWFAVYLFLHGLGVQSLFSMKQKIRSAENEEILLKKESFMVYDSDALLIACALWLLWLSVSGLVLHSFTDRMIVYPFMLLFGVVLQLRQHEVTT